MRKLLLAGTVLLGLAASPASAAIVANLGVNPTSATGAFSHAVGGTTFDDQITFQLVGGPQFLTIASVTNNFANAASQISNFTGSVFRIVGTIGGGDDVLVIGPVAATANCGANCQGFGGSAGLSAGPRALRARPLASFKSAVPFSPFGAQQPAGGGTPPQDGCAAKAQRGAQKGTTFLRALLANVSGREKPVVTGVPGEAVACDRVARGRGQRGDRCEPWRTGRLPRRQTSGVPGRAATSPRGRNRRPPAVPLPTADAGPPPGPPA